jgi:hypothetical protein
MRKITTNGLELECDDDVELAIEGNKVTIKAAPVEKVVHEHHYHYSGTTTIMSPPLGRPGISLPYFGDPVYPTWTGGTGHGPDMPFVSGLVTNPPPGLLPNTNAQALTFSTVQ